MANQKIQRSDLAAIVGLNDRALRYLENLAHAIDDVAPAEGSGNPVGVVRANRSRQYIDLDNNQLWINVAPAYGDNQLWVAV